MKAIVTKYALSTGPRIVEGELSHSSTPDRPMLVSRGTGFISQDYYHGNEFHLTKEKAAARVVDMADALRKSLLGRLAKIDKSKAKALKQIAESDLTCPPKPDLSCSHQLDLTGPHIPE